MIAPRLITIVLLALPVLTSGCSLTGGSAWNGVHISGAAGYMETELDGSLDTTIERTPGIPVTTGFDFEGNGGQKGKESTVYLAGAVGLAPLELRVSGFQYQQNSTGTFTGEFLDTTFTGMVESEFDIGAYQATLGFDILNLERFRVGILAGATILDLDLGLSDVTFPGTEESVDEILPIPVVGVRADIKITGFLRVGATGTFFPLEDIEDFDVRFMDLEGGIYLEPVSYLEIFAIYRSISLEGEGEIDNVIADFDIELSGPVFGVAVTF